MSDETISSSASALEVDQQPDTSGGGAGVVEGKHPEGDYRRLRGRDRFGSMVAQSQAGTLPEARRFREEVLAEDRTVGLPQRRETELDRSTRRSKEPSLDIEAEPQTIREKLAEIGRLTREIQERLDKDKPLTSRTNLGNQQDHHLGASSKSNKGGIIT